jgi:hypothetical protein
VAAAYLFLVRSMRASCFVLLAAMTCCGCALADDPAVEGNERLISPQELRSAISVARTRIVQRLHWCSIPRIRIESPTKIEVLFRLAPADEEYLPSITVERRRGQWYITHEAFDYILVD